MCGGHVISDSAEGKHHRSKPLAFSQGPRITEPMAPKTAIAKKTETEMYFGTLNPIDCTLFLHQIAGQPYFIHASRRYCSPRLLISYIPPSPSTAKHI